MLKFGVVFYGKLTNNGYNDQHSTQDYNANIIMLIKFEVSHFKSFEEKFVFDFEKTNDYQFNPECIKNGSVNKAIIYGANGSGKSNLGLAIFDIVSHLTDKSFEPDLYENYLNANSKNKLAEFKYVFKFEDNILEYSYAKSDINKFAYEYLKINNQRIISFDRDKDTNISINLKGAENLNTDIGKYKISIVKYVRNNSILNSNRVNDTFNKFIKFVDNMLFFRSVDHNIYLGLEIGNNNIESDIIDHDNVDDFEKFLNVAGIKCKLKVIDKNGKPALAFVFNEKTVSFSSIASTGTKSLGLFYFWLQRLRESNLVPFVFIDEFDAFYHHELSEIIVKELKNINAQTILTTHNTSIMTNDLMRPDCYFLMTPEKIKSLSKCTNRELRFAHNLEKMYKAEAFYV